MREIIFRGKDCQGNWVYGNFIHSKRFEGCGNEFRIHEQETGLESDVIPETVGMYTGLNDVNGAKIFEGDIVTRVGGNKEFRYLVQYEDACFYLYHYKGLTDFEDKPLRWGTLYRVKEIGFELAVTCNIHDQ